MCSFPPQHSWFNQRNTGQILPASVNPHLLTSLDESNKNMLTLSETSWSQSQDHVQLQMHLHSCSILQPVMFVTPVYLKAPATNLHVQLATWFCQACSRHITWHLSSMWETPVSGQLNTNQLTTDKLLIETFFSVSWRRFCEWCVESSHSQCTVTPSLRTDHVRESS